MYVPVCVATVVFWRTGSLRVSHVAGTSSFRPRQGHDSSDCQLPPPVQVAHSGSSATCSHLLCLAKDTRAHAGLVSVVLWRLRKVPTWQNSTVPDSQAPRWQGPSTPCAVHLRRHFGDSHQSRWVAQDRLTLSVQLAATSWATASRVGCLLPTGRT